MKQLIFILFLFISFAGYSQQNIDIEYGKLSGIIYNTKSGGVDSLLSLNPDSLGQFLIKNVSDPQSPLDAVNFRTLIDYGGSGGLDSIVFIPGTGGLNIYAGASVIASTNLDERYVELTDSTTLWPTITQFQDSIDVLNAKINTEMERNIFSITLPSSTTIAGRIAGAISVPAGWTLSEGANSANLDITHNLGRRVASVSVTYLVSGTEYKALIPFNNAYSTFSTQDTNNLRIEGLTTIQKTIQIFITFE